MAGWQTFGLEWFLLSPPTKFFFGVGDLLRFFGFVLVYLEKFSLVRRNFVAPFFLFHTFFFLTGFWRSVAGLVLLHTHIWLQVFVALEWCL